MDWHAAARPTPMLEYGINERLYLSETQARICEMLGEEADAAFWAVNRKPDSTADAINL